MTNDTFLLQNAAKAAAAFNTSIMEVSVQLTEKNQLAISRLCVEDCLSK